MRGNRHKKPSIEQWTVCESHAFKKQASMREQTDVWLFGQVILKEGKQREKAEVCQIKEEDPNQRQQI